MPHLPMQVETERQRQRKAVVEHLVLGSDAHAPRAVPVRVALSRVETRHMVSVRTIEQVDAHARSPPPSIPPHHVHLQRIRRIELEIVRAIVGTRLRSLELSQLPVLQRHLCAHAQRKVQVPIPFKRLSPCRLLRHRPFRHACPIPRCEHNAHHRTQRIAPLVRTVQRTIAVMLELHTCLHAPAVSKAISGMNTSTEVDEPARTNQLVVDGIHPIIFLIRVAHTHAQRIIHFPMPTAKERTLKRTIHRHRISQVRIILHFLRHAPHGSRILVHRHAAIVMIRQSKRKRREAIVACKGIAVLRLRQIPQLCIHCPCSLFLQPHPHVFIRSQHLRRVHIQLPPPMRHTVVSLSKQRNGTRKTAQASDGTNK